MTPQLVFDVCTRYYKRLAPETDPALLHCRWMLNEIAGLAPNGTEMADIEKMMRWLGFIQGVLWVKGIYTIDEMRDHNRG